MKDSQDNNKESLEIYRHSSSHVMAHAVKELYPNVKLAIGPATAEGFYYDFDSEKTFTSEDLPLIEKKMREIIKSDKPFIRKEISRQEAREMFQLMGEMYKVELIDEIEDETLTVYEEDNFVDLCRGPHVKTTGELKAFKLLSVAGAYWRGNENNKMLELELFSLHDDIGSGLVLWHPHGAMIRRVIENLWTDEHYRAGYQILYTPHIAKLDLWKKTGHLDFYAENMYSPMEIEGINYEIKPMNCPFHVSVYKSRLRSYKELPIRYAELGTVYRYERSGVLHGLLRVRGFTQDDAHIFCREDQIEVEILNVLELTLFI
ncbi:MAG: aminoacyl--tRNA ligase-related protein, partial [Candidatus Hodarchaeales archaeon]